MTMSDAALQTTLDGIFAGVDQVLQAVSPTLIPREIGRIISVSTGVARVSGLPGAGFVKVSRRGLRDCF